MTVIALTFLSVLIELIEHFKEGIKEPKKVKTVFDSDNDRN
jgi:hypothetical protein